MFGEEQSVGAGTSKAMSGCVGARVDRTVDHDQLPLAQVWGVDTLVPTCRLNRDRKGKQTHRLVPCS